MLSAVGKTVLVVAVAVLVVQGQYTVLRARLLISDYVWCDYGRDLLYDVVDGYKLLNYRESTT